MRGGLVATFASPLHKAVPSNSRKYQFFPQLGQQILPGKLSCGGAIRRSRRWLPCVNHPTRSRKGRPPLVPGVLRSRATAEAGQGTDASTRTSRDHDRYGSTMVNSIQPRVNLNGGRGEMATEIKEAGFHRRTPLYPTLV